MKRNIVIATLTAAVLATGGTVAAFAAGDDETATQRHTATGTGTGTGTQVVADRDDDTDDADDRTDSEDRTTVSAANVTAADAIAAALKHTPGTVVSAELDDDGRDACTWDVDVVKGDGTEYGVEVASDTGKVLGAHRDTDEDDDADDRAELAALKGAAFDAREVALAAAAKGTVTEIGADDDHGTVAWSVETVKGGTASEWKAALDTGELTQDQDD
ncbi:PepSY domain-containing protein [Streptomyces sp. NPDC046909]|uniref:PepSY domain-containing protein n=1 Tax=Streptomyces sp. NPDC046909 TaxID=3155617 RepID=UPI0033C04726